MPRSRRNGGSRKFSSTNGFALQVLTSSGLLLKPTGPNSLRFPYGSKVDTGVEVENLHESPRRYLMAPRLRWCLAKNRRAPERRLCNSSADCLDRFGRARFSSERLANTLTSGRSTIEFGYLIRPYAVFHELVRTTNSIMRGDEASKCNAQWRRSLSCLVPHPSIKVLFITSTFGLLCPQCLC